MLLKRSFKILSVLVAVIVTLSLLCIPVAAETKPYTVRMPFSKPQLSDNSGYIEILVSSGDADTGYVSGVIIGWDMVLYNEDAAAIDTGVDIKYDSSKKQFLFQPVPQDIAGSFNYYLIRSDGSQVYYSELIVENYFTWFNVSDVLNVHVHGNYRTLVDLPQNTDYDFSFTYGDDLDTFYNMRTIINLLTAQGNTITDMSALLQTVKEYTIYQNSNLEKILSALEGQSDIIEEGNDKIIQNQEENQEEIKNGWQQEDSIDTTTTDDYAAKDKELQGATEQGRSEAVSVFNSFGSLFQSDGHLYKGLLSVSAMFTQFMKIDWVSSLLNFSLAIGVFAFVIGTGSSIFKSAHEKFESNKQSKYAASERDKAHREGLM